MSLGVGLGVGKRRAGMRGPELSPGFTGSSWNLNLNGGAAGTVTQDTTGVTFAGAQNLATAVAPSAGVKDSVIYEVTYTISGRTGGGVRCLLYGATNNHLATGSTNNANGTFTEQLTTTGATTAFLNQIRFQTTGTNGTNSFKISGVSVKEVLS